MYNGMYSTCSVKSSEWSTVSATHVCGVRIVMYVLGYSITFYVMSRACSSVLRSCPEDMICGRVTKGGTHVGLNLVDIVDSNTKEKLTVTDYLGQLITNLK